MEQCPEEGQTWTGQEDFDIHFCVIFDLWCQGFISGRETGWWPLSPPIFDILSNIYYFSKTQGLESLGNSWDNSYVIFFALDIIYPLLVVNKTYTKILKRFKILFPRLCIPWNRIFNFYCDNYFNTQRKYLKVLRIRNTWSRVNIRFCIRLFWFVHLLVLMLTMCRSEYCISLYFFSNWVIYLLVS